MTTMEENGEWEKSSWWNVAWEFGLNGHWAPLEYG
jgi:hypothetical protein